MQQIQQLLEQIQSLLPFERIIQDLHADLDTSADDPVLVEVETGVIEIPKKVDAEEIAKVVQYDCLPNEMGFRVVLAVGGVEWYRNGITQPRFCFAKLYYNEKGEFSSVHYYVGYTKRNSADK